MDEVHKPSDSVCYTSLSEDFRFHKSVRNCNYRGFLINLHPAAVGSSEVLEWTHCPDLSRPHKPGASPGPIQPPLQQVPATVSVENAAGSWSLHFNSNQCTDINARSCTSPYKRRN
jgi:hypothetical protein